MGNETLFAGRLSYGNRQWQWAETCERTAIHLQQTHQLPEVIARLLAQRQVKPEEALHFLRPTLQALMPDPLHFKDMEKAVLRTVQAIENQEPIVIFGDYDVDGATSTALLKRFLTESHIPSNFYIPQRVTEGYGVSLDATKKLKNQGYRLMITVDCGTTSFEAVTWAQENGMDVIILDHHGTDTTLPPAFALVNPNRPDDPSPHTYLCAAGLTFLFLTALRRKLTPLRSDLPDLRSLLDLVALATICDVVPLIGLNRAYVTQGLKVLSKRRNIGLQALLEIIQLQEKPTAYHLGFSLGPRINAGGRIGEADLGARLLSTQDPLEAQTLAQRLENLNQERQILETQIMEEALHQVESQGLAQNAIICVSSPTWHMGIVGIVASRLKERYHRPCFAIAIDENGIGKGSGRSIPGVDLGDLARRARQEGLLINGGGHSMAAGITLSLDKKEAFIAFLASHIQTASLTPSFMVHSSLSLAGASLEFLEMVECLSPFGPSNPAPHFVFPYVKIAYARIVGKGHIKCTLKGEDGTSLEAMAFQAENTPLEPILLSNQRNTPYHVAGTLRTNTWQGRTTVELTIKDIMGV